MHTLPTMFCFFLFFGEDGVQWFSFDPPLIIDQRQNKIYTICDVCIYKAWNLHQTQRSLVVDLLFYLDMSSYSTGNEVHVGYPMRMKSTQKIWNVHAQRVGGWRWGNANFGIRIGVNAYFSALRYQHVDIPNAKLSHWGYVCMYACMYVCMYVCLYVCM